MIVASKAGMYKAFSDTTGEEAESEGWGYL